MAQKLHNSNGLQEFVKKDGKTVYPIELSNSKGEVITFLAANTADGELNKMAQKLHNSNGLQEFVNDKDKTGRVLIIDNENKQLRWVVRGLNRYFFLLSF